MDRVAVLLVFAVVLNSSLLIGGKGTALHRSISNYVNMCLKSCGSNNCNPNAAENSKLPNVYSEWKTSETNGDASSSLRGTPGMPRLKGRCLNFAGMKGRVSRMLMILIEEIEMLESQALQRNSVAVKMTLRIDITEPKTLTDGANSDAFDSSDNLDKVIKITKLETYERPTGSFLAHPELELYVVCFVCWLICAGILGFHTYFQSY